MFAIVETGSKQYRVAPGDVIEVEKLAGSEGDTVELRTLAVQKDGEDTITAGQALADAKVTGTILRSFRGDKIIVYKFKRKKQYQRKNGHRQDLIAVRVDSIDA